MVVPLPVIVHGGLLAHGLRVGQGDADAPVRGGAGGEQHLHRVDGLPHVAAAGAGDVGQGGLVGLHLHMKLPRHIVHRPIYRLPHRCRGQTLELKDGGTAQNRVEHVEIGVLRGGGDQSDLAVLNVLQQGLLLLLVEGLDLVQIEQDAVGGQHGVQLGDDGLDIRRGGGSCVELEQLALGLLGDDVRHGGLPGARGAIENQIGHRAGLDDPPQDGPLAQNMVLAVDLR